MKLETVSRKQPVFADLFLVPMAKVKLERAGLLTFGFGRLNNHSLQAKLSLLLRSRLQVLSSHPKDSENRQRCQSACKRLKFGRICMMQKVAVVTGAAKGLGKAIALSLALDGYIVAVHYRKSKADAQKELDSILEKSPKSILVSGDLTDEKQAEAALGQIYKKLGRIDLLVNNVGNFLYREFSKTTNFEFRDIVESNVYSTLFCSRAVLPMMRKNKFGSIINIGAAGADRFIFRRHVVPYFMAKNGVYVLTKAMAQEESRYGIRINMVSPASMRTDIFKKKDFPMGREVKYSDVAKAIKFLISKDAYYINGANVEVAGAFIPGMK